MAESQLPDAARSTLATIARQSVVAAAKRLDYFPPSEAIVGQLAAPGASFVTLRSKGELRGCIGSIEARRPLAIDVAENARAAVLDDLRFHPVAVYELEAIEIELSLLAPPQPFSCGSRAELLAALAPGVDGLVLEEHGRRATFLPSVWAQLPDPASFVAHLERKAGFVAGSWSAARRVFRYRVESLEVGPVLA